MSDDGSDPNSLRFNQVIADYLAAVASGSAPDREELIGRHPELADGLRSFFADHDAMKAAKEGVESPTLPPRPSDTEAATIPPGAVLDSPTLPPSQADTPIEEAKLPPGEPKPDGPPVGTKVRYFGDYELLEEIARGGMGVVYKARQVSLNRIVALKMILAGQLAGDEDVKRFRAEAEAAANLDHPGIVPIFEVGEYDGQHYFSMGFVEGSSLSAKVADGPLPPHEAAEYAKKVAEAVAFAHEQGVIHRDLKPANVLLDRNGEPRVTDFGLAKKVEGDSDLTASGQILGTPGYMPPEQASGKIDEVTETADVYSLGAILYNLITGRPPFQADNPLDTLMQVLEREPVSPRTLNPKVPQDLETICLRCLEKDRQRRYASAQDLVDELQRFAAGEPILARPISTTERAWRWCKRKPVAAGLIASAVLLLLTLGVGGPYIAIQQARFAEQQVRLTYEANEARGQAEEARGEAEKKRQEAVEAKNSLAEEKDRAVANLYATTISLAYQAWLAHNVTRAERLLDSAPNAFRQWEWDYLKSLCHAEQMTLWGHSGVPMGLRYDPTGSRLISWGSGPLLKIWDTTTGQALQTRRILVMDVSRDGRRVAAWDERGGAQVRILEINSDKPLAVLPGHPAKAGGAPITFSAAFNHEATRLATVGGDDTTRVWDLSTGDQVLKIHEPEGRALHRVSFSPDGKLLGWKGQDGWMAIHDATTGETFHRVQEERAASVSGMTIPVSVSFSPDTRRLVTPGFDGHLRLYDSVSGACLATLRGHTDFVYGAAFSADGRWIASAGSDKTVRVWDVEQERLWLILRGHTEQVGCVAFSPDGRELASGADDTTIKIWDPRPTVPVALATSEDESDAAEADGPSGQPSFPAREPSVEFLALEGHTDAIDKFSFSPDGARLASASWDGTVKIYDATTGREILTFEEHVNRVGSVAFSPDGQLVASATGGSLSSRPGTILLWNAESGQVALRLTGHTTPVSNLKFTSDGKRLVSTGGSQQVRNKGELKVWDVVTGEPLTNVEGLEAAVRGLAVTADGRFAVTGGFDGRAHMWDLDTGAAVRSFGEQAVAFSGSVLFLGLDISPDGRHLAGAGSDNSVRVWKLDNAEQVQKLQGHTRAAYSVGFSHDGRRLVSGSLDNTVKIWDPMTGLELLTLPGHRSEVYDVAFSPDGRLLASCSYDGRLLVRGGKMEPPIQTDDWPVVLADNFDRAELGEKWKTAMGTWSIDGGALKGVLKTNPGATPDVRAPNPAIIVLSGMAMPSAVEVSFDYRTSNVPSCSIAFASVEEEKNCAFAHYISAPVAQSNDGDRGSLVSIVSSGNSSEVAANKSAFVDFDRQYRFRVVREPGRLSMFLDDKKVLSARVPNFDLPMLQILGAWGKPGDIVYLDNLEIRMPESAFAERDALALVDRLFKEKGLKEEVLRHIREAPDLAETVRQAAIEIAERRVVPPGAAVPLASTTWTDESVGMTLTLPDKKWKLTDKSKGPACVFVFSPVIDRSTRCSVLYFPCLMVPAGMVTREASVKANFGGSYRRIALQADTLGGKEVERLQYGNGAVTGCEYGLRRGDYFLIIQLSAPDTEWKNEETRAQLKSIRDSVTFTDDGQGVTPPSAHVPLTSNTWTDDKVGISLTRPNEKWRLTNQSTGPVGLFLFSPKEDLSTRCTVLYLPPELVPLGLISREAIVKAQLGKRYKRIALDSDTLNGKEVLRWEYAVGGLTTVEYGLRRGDLYLVFQLCAPDKDWSDQQSRAVLEDVRQSVTLAQDARFETPSEDAGLLVMRGNTHMQRGQWAEAAAAYSRVVQIAPKQEMEWLRAAPLFILADDTQGYREHCRAMLDAFRDGESVSAVGKTCKVCLLLPGSVDLSDLPIKKLHDALEAGSVPSNLQGWVFATAALAAYRAGDARETVRWTQKSQETDTYTRTPGLQALDLVLLAMAQHQMQQPQDARRSLAQANVVIDEHMTKISSGEFIPGWHNWLIAQILRQEAERLMAEPAKEKAQPE